MRTPRKKILLFLGDFSIITLSFFIAPPIKFRGFVWDFSATYWTLSTGYFILSAYLIIFFLADLYNIELKPLDKKYFFRLMSAIAMATAIQTGVFFMVPSLSSSRGIFLVNTISVSLLTFLWRVVFEQIFRHIFRRKKNVLIIGGNSAGKLLYRTIRSTEAYRPLEFILDEHIQARKSKGNPSILNNARKLNEIIETRAVDVVVIAEDKKISRSLTNDVLAWKLRGVEIYEMPQFYEYLTGMIPVNHINHQWLIASQLLGVEKSVYNIRIKRLIDLLLASLGIIITLPLMVLVIFLIKIESPGGAFFRQRRIGLYGKPFFLYKFRTMYVESSNIANRRLSAREREKNITRVGRFLRYARIDEIPQMWNVLIGEMSFIGPRALIENEVKLFEEKVPYFPIRHSVRPGITGWAQVKYKHGSSLHDALEKVKYDLFYIKNLSALLDADILLKTVKVVLYGRGAQ